MTATDALALSPSGTARKSSITDCEDVSYVSSPFLPMTLRNPTSRPTSSNSSKAWMARKGVSTIRDDLSEALVLGHVKLLVGEFIPFGCGRRSECAHLPDHAPPTALISSLRSTTS